jgi:hypothetical protein
MKQEDFKTLLKRVYKFKYYHYAHRFMVGCSETTKKPHFIILGDYPGYWVCDAKTARLLEKLGYEITK